MKDYHLLRLFLTVTFVVWAILARAQDSSPSPPPTGAPTNQDKAPQASGPFIRSTTNLVLVDVVVSHDGHSVKGLERQAFHIFENGREQAIKVFEEHGPGYQ
jgi:hypothetical protein